MKFVSFKYSVLGLCVMSLGGGASLAQTSVIKPSKSASSGDRAQLVVAMPKTYGRAETMTLWGDYFSHLASCGNIDIMNQQGENLSKSANVDVLAEKDLIDSIKSGKAQLAQVNPGIVAQLVSSGEPKPFAVPGNRATGKANSYHLILISRVDSGLTKPSDLVGKKIAHTTPTSNSGNLAPRALFPGIGLTPDKDYEVVFSNGHERSIMGVMHGFWPAAAVASDLFQRMTLKGEIRASSIRTIWQSPPFMTESWMMGKDVSPDVQARVKKCSTSYKFSPNLVKLLPGNNALVPINFDRDFATVMLVYDKARAQAK